MRAIGLSTAVLTSLLQLLLAASAFAQKIDPALAKTDEQGSIQWYDIQNLGIEGKGWSDTKSPFDRFPAKAEKSVRPEVWSLSRHSAGLCVRFVTDSPTIRARWTVTSNRLEMPHMPATGVSGLDLYKWSKADMKWRWVAVAQPSKRPTNDEVLVTDVTPDKDPWLLYLPLYNGV